MAYGDVLRSRRRNCRSGRRAAEKKRVWIVWTKIKNVTDRDTDTFSGVAEQNIFRDEYIFRTRQPTYQRTDELPPPIG